MKKLSEEELHELLKKAEENGEVIHETDEGVQECFAYYNIHGHYEYSIDHETEEFLRFGKLDCKRIFKYK